MENPCIMCGTPVPEGFGQVCPICEADVKDGRVPSRWEAQKKMQTNQKGAHTYGADFTQPPRGLGGDGRKGHGRCVPRL